MTITAYTSKGTAFAMGDPVSVELHMAMDTPADRFEGVFPCANPLPELHQVSVEKDGEVVFFGLVDEQSVEYGGQGGRVYLCARSLAAALLDNEAVVQNYYKPTLQEMYKRHAKPYGILGVRGASAAYNGTLTLSKGQSEWAALARFCEGVGGLYPRITPDRYLDVRLTVGDAVWKYSNTAVDGIRYSSVSHERKRCEPISQVNMKSADGGVYDFTETNTLIRNKGIERRRLMEIRQNAGEVQRSAREQMRESNYAYEQYRLRAADGRIPPVGSRGTLDDAGLGLVKNLVVAEVSYRLSAQGESYDVVLIPETNLK